MAQARSLEKLLHDLSLCEEMLARLLLLFSALPSDRMRNLGDSLFQPLNFLLITMAETGATPTADGVELLRRLTEDRGELMTSLQERYFDSETGLDKEEKRYLFELTELFARTVCLIHELAESWRIWTTS
ncbi:MAG: hypothetical protein PHN75_11875 [Syntrophales bacterium]|nr:hypothetical protein [Syntrophales bacterium]